MYSLYIVRITSPELPPMAVQYRCHMYHVTSILPPMAVQHNFDTVLFLETGTSDRCLIYIVQCLRFSGLILYPLSLFLYSPFNMKWVCDMLTVHNYFTCSLDCLNHNWSLTVVCLITVYRS